MTIPPDSLQEGERKPFSAVPPAPLDGFAPEEFRARRAALRKACPEGILLLRGSTEDEVHGPVRYRQNSSFFYLTGVSTPGAFLVMLPEGVPASAGARDLAPEVREILFLPARNATVETWTGPKLGPGEETEKATGIEKTLEAGTLWNALTGWLRHNPLVFMLMPYGEQARLTREYALIQRLSDIAPVVQFRDCALPLGRQRMVKSPAEIDRVRQAIAITAEGQRAARQVIRSGAGQYEYQAEARALEAFRSKGASLAFGSIVGGGFNATVLHYEDNHSELRQGDLVVVDIGARVGGYCGDLTRTYPVGGAVTERQREIYDLVMAAHQNTITSFQPGEDSLKSINDRCKEFLKNASLRAVDTQGKEQTMDVFMPHGLSHHLGLDVHDVGEKETPLPPGCVITVEPGLYLPSEGIGVRIEDDYLVTENGLELLGPPLEKELAAVLAAMQANG